MYTPEEYRKKIRKISAGYFLLVPPTSVNVMTRLFKWVGADSEEVQIRVVRGFSSEDENYLEKFRLRPCAAIIKTIILRTENYTA